MSDRRTEILDNCDKDYIEDFGFVTTPEGMKEAMDIYMKESVMEAFEWLVKNTSGHSIDENGKCEFKYKGEWITKEQLFENFL